MLRMGKYDDLRAMREEGAERRASFVRPKATARLKVAVREIETAAPSVAISGAGISRLRRWREGHREEYRAYMREYMRKRRAK
jgi:hypothetical protein